jgi:CDP-diacylglycerol--glycerol-3-phosphate 3-phosphatidyltransferase
MKAAASGPDQERSPGRLFPRPLIALADRLKAKAGPALRTARVHPNLVSLAGLAAGLAAGALFSLARPAAAGAALILCGLLDVLDGTIAVQAGRRSLLGAILDSSLDRYAEFFVYAGLAFYFRDSPAMWLAWAAFLGSVMASYARARAEGLGVAARTGIMQRAERLAVLVLAAFLGPAFGAPDPALVVALGLIALLSQVTVGQRILAVRRFEAKLASPSALSQVPTDQVKP